MPVAAGYLSELERRLPLGPGLQVFHSAGGMMPVAAARARPIAMAKSGPAAGVAASAALARRLGLPRVLTFDMGGTTTDVCLILDGQPAMADGGGTSDRPLRQPALAVQSIGAGGGSLVRLGPGGLSVGPHSAGAEPGPACYGRGGLEPTVTDANLLLGYLDPEAELGGVIRLDPRRAAAALAPVADALGMDLLDAAQGVLRVANAAMARALRGVTVERGVDGRDCVLLAFGGGGPMHAAGLADLYGIATVLVPPASSAFSALGCLQADMSFIAQATVRTPLADAASLDDRLATLAETAAAPLAGHGGVPAIEHTALMRYEAQSGTLPIPFTTPLDPAAVHRDFGAGHHALYGYSTEEPAVIEALRVQARLPSDLPPMRPASAPPRPAASRLCHFPGAPGTPTAILGRGSFTGTRPGPALVVDEWSTTVVPPGWQVHAHADGHLVLDRTP